MPPKRGERQGAGCVNCKFKLLFNGWSNKLTVYDFVINWSSTFCWMASMLPFGSLGLIISRNDWSSLR